MERVSNPNGYAPNLVPAHPGNQNRLVHGVYSTRRELTPEARAIADDVLAAPHTIPLDRAAAEEIGSMIVLLGRVDAALADGRVENRKGQVRALIDLRGRLSRQLLGWLREFGLTPASRADFAARLAGGTVAEEVRRRLGAVGEEPSS
jgi:hypothetical protein